MRSECCRRKVGQFALSAVLSGLAAQAGLRTGAVPRQDNKPLSIQHKRRAVTASHSAFSTGAVPYARQQETVAQQPSREALGSAQARKGESEVER